MAEATVKSKDVVFVLELTEAEAVYVHSALLKTHPTELMDDTVYEALGDAMSAAGVEANYSASTAVS